MWRRALVRCAPALRPSPSRAASQLLAYRALHLQAPSSSPFLRASSVLHSHHRCFASQSDNGNDTPVAPVDASITESSGAPGVESPGEKFVMLYTCSVCETRSAKTISKHAYYKGVVLVRCPGCQNLHLIADRLGWFEDDAVDVESLLQKKGEQVRFVTAEDVLELTENDILGQKKET